MPKCAKCGNSFSFGCSAIPSVTPAANGLVSGLIGNFDQQGHITEMDSLINNLDQVQEAWEFPEEFFDTCYECGSNEIIWE
ncbi:hypothetical protein [Phosphitispora sp. TUW77]|uniref:hypothetical protein n=1 Tax=Phosphitispora sp. TUW77 TaxID=3152361 RepID=UPI003AB842B8